MSDKFSFFQFLINRDLWWIFPTVFGVGTVLFSSLYLVARSPFTSLKKIFYIPARKSITNAVQLGGLPLSLSIISGIFLIYNHKYFHSFFSEFDYYSIKYWLLSSCIIVLYGYFDDRFELRPMVKLFLQLSCIGLFAVLESRVLFPKWGALAFMVISFWGLGVLNGSNLLDGLDTLTIKLGGVTYFSFLIIAYNFSIPSATIGSLVGLSALASFYFFNKEPAKIHLGEIGGSFIGFTSLLFSCFVYSFLTRIKVGQPDALAMSLMPLSLPMVELGVSFLRRLYTRKSPFKGDRFHLHHILRNYYNFSPSNASSVYALGYASIMGIGFSITHYFGPILGLVSSIGLLTSGYIAIGLKHWESEDTLNLRPNALFVYLLKKDIGVISSIEVDDFQIQIIGKEEADLLDLEHSDEKESSHDSGKKAA